MEKRVELDHKKADYIREMLAVRDQINASIQSVVGFACVEEPFTPQTQWKMDGNAIVLVLPVSGDKE